MKSLLAVCLILVLLMPYAVPVRGAVTSVEVTPAAPVQGDIVQISVVASPGESVPITLSFTKVLTVQNGVYNLDLNGVSVPQTPNSFTVKASGVTDLNVAVKILFWITESATATGGVATVSQGGVPEGSYEGKIYGNAAPGSSTVTLTVTASTTVTMGADGKYTLSYDTRAIPPGDFTAKIGGVTKSLTLSSSSGGGGGGGGAITPVAVASFPSTAYVGEEVEFDGSGSNKSGGTIVGWNWVFGDGAAASGSTTGHTYSKTGNYTVALTVTDNVGVSSAGSWKISVVDRPNLSPVSKPGSGRTIFLRDVADFDGGASHDPDGNITSYSWSFGDGSEAVGVRVSHFYKDAGVYRVALTVRDDDGVEASASLFVTVVSPPVQPVSNYTVRLEEGRVQRITPSNSSIPISVTLNVTSPLSLTLFKYPYNPHSGEPLPLNSIPQFFDISLSNLDAVDWPILIELDYSAFNLTEAEAGRLGLYFYNGTGWSLCQQTGVKSGHVIWALLTRSEAAGSPIMVGEKTSGAAFQVSEFTVEPVKTVTGKYVNVSLSVINVGLEAGETQLSLLVGGQLEGKNTLTLSPGESTQIRFSFTRDVPGGYLVELGGLSGEVEFSSPPKPADIILTSLEVFPMNATTGDNISVSASYVNMGELEGAANVEIKINGLTAMSRILTLGGGESTVLRASFTFTEAGQQTITVGSESRVVQVKGADVKPVSGEEPFPVSLVFVAALLIGLGAIGFFLLRRRNRHDNA